MYIPPPNVLVSIKKIYKWNKVQPDQLGTVINACHNGALLNFQMSLISQNYECTSLYPRVYL